METKKPKVLAVLTKEELAAFNAWRNLDSAIEQGIRAAMRGVVAAAREEKFASVRESRALWSGIEKVHGLRSDTNYEVNYETGEIMEHVHTEHPLAAFLGGGSLVERSNDETQH